MYGIYNNILIKYIFYDIYGWFILDWLQEKWHCVKVRLLRVGDLLFSDVTFGHTTLSCSQKVAIYSLLQVAIYSLLQVAIYGLLQVKWRSVARRKFLYVRTGPCPFTKPEALHVCHFVFEDRHGHRRVLQVQSPSKGPRHQEIADQRTVSQ